MWLMKGEEELMKYNAMHSLLATLSACIMVALQHKLCRTGRSGTDAPRTSTLKAGWMAGWDGSCPFYPAMALSLQSTAWRYSEVQRGTARCCPSISAVKYNRLVAQQYTNQHYSCLSKLLDLTAISAYRVCHVLTGAIVTIVQHSAELWRCPFVIPANTGLENFPSADFWCTSWAMPAVAQ